MNLKATFNVRNMLTRRQKAYSCDTLVLSVFNYADSVYGTRFDFVTSRRIQIVVYEGVSIFATLYDSSHGLIKSKEENSTQLVYSIRLFCRKSSIDSRSWYAVCTTLCLVLSNKNLLLHSKQRIHNFS